MSDTNEPDRAWMTAMRRGFAGYCPSCGSAPLFHSYLKVHDTCANCKTELFHHQADDAPPYFTIFIAGHILVGGVLALEQYAAPPAWLHLVLWLPLTVVMCLWLLPKIKGAFVGLQWALRMHGFADAADAGDTQSLR
ncbi:MAG: DUF983 domain-containing protein [Pseudomonadota bacterium]